MDGMVWNKLGEVLPERSRFFFPWCCPLSERLQQNSVIYELGGGGELEGILLKAPCHIFFLNSSLWRKNFAIKFDGISRQKYHICIINDSLELSTVFILIRIHAFWKYRSHSRQNFCIILTDANRQ